MVNTMARRFLARREALLLLFIVLSLFYCLSIKCPLNCVEVVAVLFINCLFTMSIFSCFYLLSVDQMAELNCWISHKPSNMDHLEIGSIIVCSLLVLLISCVFICWQSRKVILPVVLYIMESFYSTFVALLSDFTASFM